jgi:hypothetical protein
MSSLYRLCALLVAALVIGCTGAQPSSSPPASPPPSAASTPSAAPSSSANPSGTLDPSLSDAGIVGRATLTNDTRAGRNGTYDIIGVDADSSCGISFEGDEVIAVAARYDAPEGQLRQMGVSVPRADVPSEDGQITSGITDGGASFDFVSQSGIGTQYSGNAADDDRTSATIAVTRHGAGLTFDFSGSTWDSISFSGQLVCAVVDD